MPRNVVFVRNNICSAIAYEDNKCPECGHQINGWTIKAFQPLYRKLIDENKEAKELLRQTLLERIDAIQIEAIKHEKRTKGFEGITCCDERVIEELQDLLKQIK